MISLMYVSTAVLCATLRESDYDYFAAVIRLDEGMQYCGPIL